MSSEKHSALSVKVGASVLSEGVVREVSALEGKGAIIVLGCDDETHTSFSGDLNILDFACAVHRITEHAIDAFGSDEFQSALMGVLIGSELQEMAEFDVMIGRKVGVQ